MWHKGCIKQVWTSVCSDDYFPMTHASIIQLEDDVIFEWQSQHVEGIKCWPADLWLSLLLKRCNDEPENWGWGLRRDEIKYSFSFFSSREYFQRIVSIKLRNKNMKGWVFQRITHLDLKQNRSELVPVKFYFKRDEALFNMMAEISDLT